MQTVAKEHLNEAIEDLYSVFAAYPLRPSIYGCDHCVFPEDDARLRSKPLRESTWEDLQKFAHKAMTTWGDEEDFKHFLPRLFELTAEEDNWPISIDRLVPGKLRDAQWSQWPDAERKAVTTCLLALWTWRLIEEKVSLNAHEFLYSVTEAGLELQPYLDIWTRALSERESSWLHLVEFIDWVTLHSATSWTNHDPSQPDERAGAYLGDPLIAWLLRPDVKDILVQAQASSVSEPDLNQIGLAIGQIEWLGSIPKEFITVR